MDRTLKICAVQMAATEDRVRNVKKAVELVELAAAEGASIIALPELFNTPWFPASIDKSKMALAEGADGPSISEIREAASRSGAVVVANIFERDGEHHFNTAFTIGPDGEILGRYRKVHVPQLPLWEEKSYFEPGDLGFPVVDTPFARIGVQICWDVFFPEGFRILALKGAELIVAPTASAFLHSHGKWERAITASAHANGVYVLRVNRVGTEPAQEFYGRSFCAGPDGEMIGEPSGASEGIVIAEIDMAEIARMRSEWVFLKDRRPEDYKEIAEATALA